MTLGKRDVCKRFKRRSERQGRGPPQAASPNRRVALTARAGGRGARLLLTGHPNGGPLISGPQLEPWVCQETAVDEDCNQPASYALLARTEEGFEPYDPESPPSGIQDTTTTEGETVPFIVRVGDGLPGPRPVRIATLFEPGEAVGAVGAAAGLEPRHRLHARRLVRHRPQGRQRAGRPQRGTARQGLHRALDGAQQPRPQLQPGDHRRVGADGPRAASSSSTDRSARRSARAARAARSRR